MEQIRQVKILGHVSHSFSVAQSRFIRHQLIDQFFLGWGRTLFWLQLANWSAPLIWIDILSFGQVTASQKQAEQVVEFTKFEALVDCLPHCQVSGNQWDAPGLHPTIAQRITPIWLLPGGFPTRKFISLVIKESGKHGTLLANDVYSCELLSQMKFYFWLQSEIGFGWT